MTWIAEVLGSVICEPTASALVAIVADACGAARRQRRAAAFRETLLTVVCGTRRAEHFGVQVRDAVARQQWRSAPPTRRSRSSGSRRRLSRSRRAASGTLEARQRLVALLIRLNSKMFVVLDGKRRRPALSLMSANPLLSWPQHAANVPPSPDAHAPFASLTRWIPFVVDGDTFDGVRQRVLAAVALLSKPAALASFGLFESGAMAHPVDIQNALDMLHLAPNSVVLLSAGGARDRSDEVAVSASALSCALLILLNAPNGRVLESSALLAALHRGARGAKRRGGVPRSGGDADAERACDCARVFGLLHQLLEPKQRTSNRLDRLQVLHAWRECASLEPTLSMDGAAERLRQIYPLCARLWKRRRTRS
jgi:hypothetical protein